MNRAERIANAITNKVELIDLKKSAVKLSDATSSFITKVDANKSEEKVSDSTPGILSKTIVGNTYYVMDSHEDVHVDGCFAKSLRERGDKVFHLHDHEYKITSKVGKPIRVYEKEIAWKDLGVEKNGMTQALMMDTEVRKDYNERIYKAYKDGEIDQHSVGMAYVKIELAADDEDNKPAYKLWKETLPLLANKDVAEENGFFFVVKEAILREISGVLIGSNTITPTMETKLLEPSKDTQLLEPSADTPNSLQKLINNFNKQF